MNTRTPADRRPLRRAAVALTALALVAGACGGDDDDAADEPEPAATEPAAEPADSTPAETAAEGTEPAGEAPEGGADLDGNGDGKVLLGVATPGPRDDGAYYQALVDQVIATAAANGFPEPIIVDNVPQAEAATELENLVAQGVDVLVVAASELADPMPELSEKYSDVYWFCSCGAGFAESEFYSQNQDDNSEISYTAGVATGILLRDSGGDSVSFIGCCDLGFEKEAVAAFELGLQSVDESFTITYVPAGDFNDIAAATEAFNNALAAGADAIYPYLGGAHEALVQLANENDLIVMSAGASDACEREDLSYSIAVRFDGGDYLEPVFEEIISGAMPEGTVRVFRVGVDPQPGALICDPTDEQAAELDAAYQLVASGELAEQFGAIKAAAYGF